MRVTTTSYSGWRVPIEYRIDHERNGKGRDRWVVRSSDLDGELGRHWQVEGVYRSEKRARRKLQRLRKALADSTWAIADRETE